MSEPTRLSVKRKATDDPPDYLVLQGARQDATHIRYVRRRRKDKTEIKDKDVNPFAQASNAESTKSAERQRQASRRIYELQHSRFAPASITGKRKSGEDAVATFVERKKHKQSPEVATQEVFEAQEQPPTRPLKRPGKGTAVRRTIETPTTAETKADRQQLEALAEYMHQAALEEVKRESRPMHVATPKLSGARSRDIHRQRVATNGSVNGNNEVEMGNTNEYVYDTYVLAPTTEVSAIEVEAQDQLDNVGYLVITDEDQSLWEMYLEDAESEKDWDTDDEDENAEDYYGADYPEDELDSDDEFDRDPYGYRDRGGSDDEGWDEDTGADSDDEYEKMMNPFRSTKTAQQFAKYLHSGESDH